MKKLILLFSSFLFLQYGFAQVKSDTIDDLLSFIDTDLADLMNIPIVSASKKAESSFDAPLSTSVITANDIRNSGATTIEEVFRLVPGFIVREKTNGNFDIHIRGNDNVPPGNFTFNSTNSLSLVMIDGRKVYNQMNGGTLWETLPISLTDIEQIEIIRGPSAALYGPNAVSGVINIITKKGLKDDKKFAAIANAQGGTQNTINSNISLAGKINKLTLRLSGNMDNRQRFEDTYYNYLTQKYTSLDSIIDWQGDQQTPMSAEQVNNRYENSEISKKKLGANLYAHYDFSDDITIDAALSTQKSLVQTIFMETTTTPLAFRESATNSADIRANIHGLSAQASVLNGFQDIYVGSGAPLQYDFQAIDANLEYDLTNKSEKFSFRPGVNYQFSKYNDQPYLTDEQLISNTGLLNGERDLSTIGITLRSDYKVNKQIRLIGAVRADKYNYPDDIYWTYQFIGTYSINEGHMFRALTSRANRGSFMADVHANFSSGGVLYAGNKDINLPVMNMFEIGSRNRITSFLQTDIELFYTKTENFTGLIFDNFDPTKGMTLRYQNYATVAEQLGATFTVNITPSKKLLFKVFGTIQQTTLKDYAQDDYSYDLLIADVLQGKPAEQTAPPIPTPDTLSSFSHKGTPSFYGGITMTYKPTKKLTAFVNLYAYTQQEYMYEGVFNLGYPLDVLTNPEPTAETVFIPKDEIEMKARVDLKVSYKLWKDNAIFVNGRNIFNTQSNEFGFGENIGGLYLVGLDLAF